VTPTVSAVTGWRPGELATVADRLVVAAGSVDDDAHAVRRHLGDAVDDAGGAWATTAASRADQEARRGEELAEALTGAAAALVAGAARLADAREALLVAVGRARAAGFTVADDGHVVSPPAPLAPPDVAPAERLGWSLAPEQLDEATRTEGLRAGHEAEVAAALVAVAAVDEAVADSVTGLDFPESLPSLVAAHQARTHLLGGDHVAALGTAGGVVVLARAASDIRSLVTDSRRLHHYADLARQGAPEPVLDDARRAFAYGTARHPVLRIAGRVSMGGTVVAGGMDLADGGGYDGARGWATRGFGAAGAVGAGVVMAGAALAPAVVVAGGVAVIAYGAWTAGNYAVDHWDQVEDAWESAQEWSVEQRVEAVAELHDATAWAGDLLADAGSGIGALR
jgi:hypothetical protein